jgi:hypothetical protein
MVVVAMSMSMFVAMAVVMAMAMGMTMTVPMTVTMGVTMTVTVIVTVTVPMAIVVRVCMAMLRRVLHLDGVQRGRNHPLRNGGGVVCGDIEIAEPPRPTVIGLLVVVYVGQSRFGARREGHFVETSFQLARCRAPR